MVGSIPGKIGSIVPTLKDELTRRFEELSEQMGTEKDDLETVAYKMNHYRSFFEEKRPDFALIVIPPDYYLDEEWSEKSEIKRVLVKYKKKSSLYLASDLIRFNRQNVTNVLDLYGKEILGIEKLIQTKSLYEKMFASDYIATSIIDRFIIGSKRERSRLLSEVRELTEKTGRKSIIKYLAFSRSRHCFFEPTKEKEKLLQAIFPHHSEEEIHCWLSEGSNLIDDLKAEKITDL